MKKIIKVFIGFTLLTTMASCQSKTSDKSVDSSSGVTETSSETKLVKDIKDDDFFVDANWVNDVLDDSNTIIIESAYGEGESYKKSHIPGSIHMDTMEIETEENNWNILDAQTCADAFLAKGVTKDTQLIVYSDDINAASRIAFVAYWLGVDKVKILDGGFKAWEDAGFETSKNANLGQKASEFGETVPKRPEYLISTSEDLLKEEEKNPDLVLASIRSWDEFIGKTSGYSYIEDAGEPLGAVFAKSSKSSADVAYLVNEDGTIKDPTEIFSEWKEWGITPDKQIVFYCGTGWRAATAFFICKQSGWENIQLFDGGWYDWDINHQKDPSRFPVQIGDPRDTDNLIIEE